jgi:uncharacterized 2Fe-2S/4Fe-4S cluster protein (DUF4445 family)
MTRIFNEETPAIHERIGWVQTVSLNPPTLQDNTADADRLRFALQKSLNADWVDIDFSVLKKLPFALREWGFSVRCILAEEKGRWIVTGILNPHGNVTAAGVAVDLGTSRVVLRLLNLLTGDILLEDAMDNPQLAVGPDILSRIHACDRNEGLARLNHLIVEGVNRRIDRMTDFCGLTAKDIYLMAVSGNTCMTHLFLNLSPRWMIREPYIPVINRPGLQQAASLGIAINPAARILVLPNIGSYFGGDLLAGILCAGMGQSEETHMLVDVGTNAEVVLGNQNWLIACAGAAGPALEGGVTQMGMMAGPGVIDQVTVDGESGVLQVHTIDEKAPVGICGSGLIDLAAGLFLAGMVDVRGKFVPAACGDRLVQSAGIANFEIVPADDSGTGKAIRISQADMDSLLRSKAAMYTILETIMTTVNVSWKELTTFYVAGTFGAFIRPAAAVSIGMLPDLPREKFISLGNSSLQGATRVLTDRNSLQEIDHIREKITYIELNVNQEFMNRFSAAKFLPHTNRTLFPSVSLRA